MGETTSQTTNCFQHRFGIKIWPFVFCKIRQALVTNKISKSITRFWTTLHLKISFVIYAYLWWCLYLFAKLDFPQNTRDGKISFYSPPWTRKSEKVILRVFLTNWVCILSIRMALDLRFGRFYHLSSIFILQKKYLKSFLSDLHKKFK